MISGASPAPETPELEGAKDKAPAGLIGRLLTGRVAGLLARNTVVSCFAFVFDLALLWAFVEYLGMNKLVAAAIAFVIATTLHYAFARTWIFKGTERAVGSGYVYFLINAVVGLVLTLVLFWAFMAIGLHYVIARVVASVFAGLTIFVLNAVFNFKSV